MSLVNQRDLFAEAEPAEAPKPRTIGTTPTKKPDGPGYYFARWHGDDVYTAVKVEPDDGVDRLVVRRIGSSLVQGCGGFFDFVPIVLPEGVC